MVVSLSSPLLVGVYEDTVLIEQYEHKEHTSDVLPKIFDEILSKYTIKGLFFARGPGSFMAVKITYIFLKTLSVVLGVNLLASDGFLFNNNAPIRALKRVYFIKENDEIRTKVFSEDIEQIFSLPKRLDKKLFSSENEPLYILPAV